MISAGGVIVLAKTISAGSLAQLKRFQLQEFFSRNYDIVKQFKNVMRNFSGVIDLAETMSKISCNCPFNNLRKENKKEKIYGEN
jgi:hypothetical protein